MLDRAFSTGPQSKSHIYTRLRADSPEAVLLENVRTELTEYCGGDPSIVQRMLIEDIAWLTLHMAQMRRRMVANGEMTQHDSIQYLAWNNSHARTMLKLGVKPAASRVPAKPARTLQQHIAERARANAGNGQAPQPGLAAPGQAA